MTLTYAAENQDEARFAPLIKDAYAKIGVKVTLKPILFNQQWALAKGDPKKAQDMFLLLYWPTYSDAGADNLWSLFHSSAKPFFNLSYWNDPAYDKLVDTGAAIDGDVGPRRRSPTLQQGDAAACTTRRPACTSTTQARCSSCRTTLQVTKRGRTSTTRS